MGVIGQGIVCIGGTFMWGAVGFAVVRNLISEIGAGDGGQISAALALVGLWLAVTGCAVYAIGEVAPWE